MGVFCLHWRLNTKTAHGQKYVVSLCKRSFWQRSMKQTLTGNIQIMRQCYQPQAETVETISCCLTFLSVMESEKTFSVWGEELNEAVVCQEDPVWINTFQSVSVQFWPHTFGHVRQWERRGQSQSESASVCRCVFDLSKKYKFIFNPFTALNQYTFRF